MDAEENKNSAISAEEKPAARKSRVARKPAARKSSAAAVTTEGAAAAPAAEKPARKPRTRKAAAPAAEPAAAAQAVPAPAKEEPKKPARKSRTRKADVPAPAPKPAPAQDNSAPAPAPAPAPEPAPAPKPAPAPAPAPVPTPVNERKTRQPEPAVQSRPVRQEQWEPDSRDFPTPEPAPGFSAPETVGGNEGGGKNRRKRRRNRRNRENGEQPQSQAPVPKVDPDELVRRAWKIYLGEVTEEGLALMDDRIAAEASRRAFRVAELFLIEAARYRQPAPRAEQTAQAPESAEVADEPSADEM